MSAGLVAMRLADASNFFAALLVAMFVTFAAPGMFLGYAKRGWRGCIIDGAVTGLLGLALAIVVLSILPGRDPATLGQPPTVGAR